MPLEQAIEASDADALALGSAGVLINLLSPFEAARLRDTLTRPGGGGFIRAAAAFCRGDYQRGIDGMTRAVTPHGRISWPIATYLPFFWAP
ncbi:hypothetical protein ABTH75_18630, partial [Acinetobacter baumannii]